MRVELRPCAFLQPAHRFLLRESLAVGPVSRHRVVRVAYEDDPRLDRNVLALTAVGVARPVEALVAVADDRTHFFEPVDRRDDPLPQLRMLLDDRALFVRERPGLGQDRFGNPDLPDVVEECAELESLERTAVEA